ncbi:MAG: NAD-dependent epimerase/dehydratase family protein [Gammaproteobacteria bacterium]|nr:NAD-dependent epimerase/dehydratase family protein [Gammaproteobacteria bacterium]MDH3559485.1 NAD-dependent epimerase/dehydratase family protein [Gammaproteobacteria bacterium]
MSRYLVTGGCGFVGSHLAEALVASGHKVCILDNLSRGKRENIPQQCELIIGDITDSDTVDAAMHAVDGCFHLAAANPAAYADGTWQDNHQVNLVGTVNVFNAAARHNSTPVVYTSSAEVYGNNATLPLSERARPCPLTAYGADKLACEYYARMLSVMDKLPSMGLRLFNVYGPRQHPDSPYSGIINRIIDQLAQGKPVTLPDLGEQELDFIYVDDTVRMLVATMQLPMQVHEVINACTGRMTSYKQLAGILATIYYRPLHIIKQPSGSDFICTRVGDPSRAIELLGIRAETQLGDGLTLTVRDILKDRNNGSGIGTSAANITDLIPGVLSC